MAAGTRPVPMGVVDVYEPDLDPKGEWDLSDIQPCGEIDVR